MTYRMSPQLLRPVNPAAWTPPIGSVAHVLVGNANVSVTAVGYDEPAPGIQAYELEKLVTTGSAAALKTISPNPPVGTKIHVWMKADTFDLCANGLGWTHVPNTSSVLTGPGSASGNLVLVTGLSASQWSLIEIDYGAEDPNNVLAGYPGGTAVGNQGLKMLVSPFYLF